MSESNRTKPAAVEVIVAPVVDSSPAPSAPPSEPTLIVSQAPTTDPEVTRLAQELGTIQAESATMRATMDSQAVELGAVRRRLEELEIAATEPDELEEIDVPPAPAPSASAAVPLAAKRERGLLAKMFLGQ